MSSEVFVYLNPREQKAVDETPAILATVVYKSKSLEVGFAVDVLSRDLMSWILADGWKCSLNGEIKEFSVESKSKNFLLGTFLSGGDFACIVFHNPDSMLLDRFNEVKDVDKKNKTERLKRRYGLGAAEDCQAEISKILLLSGEDLYAALDRLSNNCAFISIWPRNSLGHGLCFDVLSMQMGVFLEKMARECSFRDIKFRIVDRSDDLPVS